MDGQRFDALTRSLASSTSRRRLLRSLAAGTGAFLGGLIVQSHADARHKGLGVACNSSAECTQTGGPVVCASNGIATDGALNCCRSQGGACSTGSHCCGDLICASNGITTDGALNCCRNEGGPCTSGAGCCGALQCTAGVCRANTGGRVPGQECTSTSQCSQTGGVTICASNGISSDGALNCCRNAGGACANGYGCCGALTCTGGVCTGPVTVNRPLGAECTANGQCSQSGGTVTCASNGITSDGALNCCRNEGGVCAAGAHCCGDLACASNGISADGALNCCRNAGGRCSSGAGCCGALACTNGICR